MQTNWSFLPKIPLKNPHPKLSQTQPTFGVLEKKPVFHTTTLAYGLTRKSVKQIDPFKIEQNSIIISK